MADKYIVSRNGWQFCWQIVSKINVSQLIASKTPGRQIFNGWRLKALIKCKAIRKTWGLTKQYSRKVLQELLGCLRDRTSTRLKIDYSYCMIRYIHTKTSIQQRLHLVACCFEVELMFRTTTAECLYFSAIWSVINDVMRFEASLTMRRGLERQRLVINILFGEALTMLGRLERDELCVALQFEASTTIDAVWSG